MVRTADPVTRSPYQWLGALLALTALRLAVAGLAPLSGDEAYYWVWSRALAPGYLDHPPMVALWIRAGTWLAGGGPIGVRLLGPLSALAGSLLLADAAKRLFPGRHAAVPAVALLNATLMLGAGSIIMTPDTPLLFFWTAALWSAVRAVQGKPIWWLACGALAGGALLSKYTGGLLGLGLAAWLLGTQPGRDRLRQWQPWAGGALALALFLPVVAWNAAHGWISFVKQGGREGDWSPALAGRYLAELAGSQLGLATPVIFVLCIAGVWRAIQARREPGAGLLLAVTLVPAAVFVEHAFGGRVQGNWPAVLYPSACLAAAGYARRGWRWGAGIGLAMALAVYAQAALAPLALPRRLDPTLVQMGGWPALARDVAAARRAAGAGFVAGAPYGLASELAYRSNARVAGVGTRWALLPLLPLPERGVGLLVVTARRREAPDPAVWAEAVPLGQLDRTRDGMVAESYRLYRVRLRSGIDARWLPREDR